MGKHTGWINVRRLYPPHNLKRGLLYPLAICSVIWVGLFFARKNVYQILGDLSGMIVSSFPSIIGFILAGYAILIGCSNQDILKRICSPTPKEGSSIFQRTSATFAVVMGSLITTLLSGFVVNIFIKGEYEFWFCCGDKVFNLIIFILLSYISIYSLWSLVDITSNLFNYSQFINAQIQSEPGKIKGCTEKFMEFISNLKKDKK